MDEGLWGEIAGEGGELTAVAVSVEGGIPMLAVGAVAAIGWGFVHGFIIGKNPLAVGRVRVYSWCMDGNSARGRDRNHGELHCVIPHWVTNGSLIPQRFEEISAEGLKEAAALRRGTGMTKASYLFRSVWEWVTSDSDPVVFSDDEALSLKNDIAAAIKSARLDRGKTTLDLSTATGISMATLSALECGECDDCSIGMLIDIADALGRELEVECVLKLSFEKPA